MSPTFTRSGSVDLQTMRSPYSNSGYILSESMIIGNIPPKLGTSSLFTKLLTMSVQFTTSIGISITQRNAPITVSMRCPAEAAAVFFSVFCFIISLCSLPSSEPVIRIMRLLFQPRVRCVYGLILTHAPGALYAAKQKIPVRSSQAALLQSLTVDNIIS